MSRVHSRDTKPELFVRSAVHRAGFRFRLHRKDLPGSPDLVFARYKIAVFVDGCFWHWHGCKRSRMPATNQEYWEKKIKRNVERDRANLKALEELGWSPIVIWECELEDGTSELIETLRGRRKSRE